MLREVFAIGAETGSIPVAQSALETCAGLAAARGDWPLAARVLGVAAEQALQTGLRRDPADEAFVTPLISRTQARLGASAFTQAHGEGRFTDLEAAIQQANDWLDRPL